MGKYKEFKVKESVQELKMLLSKQIKPRNISRIQSLLLLKEKRFKTRQELSNYLGVHKRTMEKWLSKYKDGGISEMLIPVIVKRESNLITSSIHKELKKRLEDSHKGFLSYVHAHQWVNQKFGVKVKYHSLRNYMINKFGTKIKRPRKSHLNKDPNAEETFLKTS